MIRKLFGQSSLAGSVTGKNNIRRNVECEDVILIEEISTYRFYGIADGQTEKAHCKTGGKETLKAVFKFIADKGIRWMSLCERDDELQYEIIKTIRETISSLSENEGKEKAEYASTLVVFAYDTNNTDYVLIHLGDGGIIGLKYNSEVKMISPPENGLTRNTTWLTTSQDALYHLRISFGTVNNYKRILMVTDGALVFAIGRNIPNSAKLIVQQGTMDDVIQSLEESEPVDDASCIVIDFPLPEQQ